MDSYRNALRRRRLWSPRIKSHSLAAPAPSVQSVQTLPPVSFLAAPTLVAAAPTTAHTTRPAAPPAGAAPSKLTFIRVTAHSTAQEWPVTSICSATARSAGTTSTNASSAQRWCTLAQRAYAREVSPSPCPTSPSTRLAAPLLVAVTPSRCPTMVFPIRHRRPLQSIGMIRLGSSF